MTTGPSSRRLPGPGRRVVLGVDGSEESYHAIESAARFAQTFGAPLHIVRVAESISMEAWAYAETARAGTESAPNAAHDQASDTVEQARDHVLAAYPGVEVETEVLYGDPGRTIAELATTRRPRRDRLARARRLRRPAPRLGQPHDPPGRLPGHGRPLTAPPLAVRHNEGGMPLTPVGGIRLFAVDGLR